MEHSPDPDVLAATTHWLPRLLQNGVDYGDFVRTTAAISEWSQWLPQWAKTADGHAERARQAEAAGNSITAGQAWLQASVSRHFGKFVWTVDPQLYAQATVQAAQELRTALSIVDPTAQRLEFDFGPGSAYANLRFPVGVSRPAYVVLIPGLDSTKEEFHRLENAHLQRGVATISLDGPGQGETGLDTALRPDYEIAVTALLDHVAARDDLDHSRVGAVGVSLGGYFAPRAAAFEPRIKALVAISGPYCFGDVFDAAPALTRSTFQHKVRAASADDAREQAFGFTLQGVLDRIAIPAMFATGDADRIIAWEQTAQQAKETAGATFVNYPGGTHTLSNLTPVARPMLADWIVAQLAAR